MEIAFVVTIKCLHCYTPLGVTQMNSSDTNSGGWAVSKMRSTTMPAFINSLPSGVRNSIGYVKKDSSTADKAFLLSYDEVFRGGYSYFTDITTRNLNNGDWWLRCPNPDNSYGFYGVVRGSYIKSYGATYSSGVFPAICIY